MSNLKITFHFILIVWLTLRSGRNWIGSIFITEIIIWMNSTYFGITKSYISNLKDVYNPLPQHTHINSLKLLKI